MPGFNFTRLYPNTYSLKDLAILFRFREGWNLHIGISPRRNGVSFVSGWSADSQIWSLSTPKFCTRSRQLWQQRGENLFFYLFFKIFVSRDLELRKTNQHTLDFFIQLFLGAVLLAEFLRHAHMGLPTFNFPLSPTSEPIQVKSQVLFGNAPVESLFKISRVWEKSLEKKNPKSAEILG